ncbi:MAG TPA: MFS transporter [Paenirhodobacter sp.]
MTPQLQRRRLALFAYFFIPGVALASWVTRTPAIRDGIQVSLAGMGLVLLGLSIGSMCGILLSGGAVSRYGTRSVLVAGMWILICGLAVMALGVTMSAALAVGLGLGLFGFGMGVAEIAINIDGAAVEQISGRPLMHTLHGCFSLGTVCGAVAGFGVASAGVPVQWHLSLIAAAAIVPIVWCARFIPADTGRATGRAVGVTRRGKMRWPDKKLGLIGLIVLAFALAEGAANDWLPILMVDEHGFSQATGSLVYVAFAAAMTVGRLAGGRLLHRLGPVAVIRLSGLFCALGLMVVVFAPVPQMAALSVVLWGLGAALGFPIAISAAGASGPDATQRVKAVTICGYTAFLVGPPLLGLIGEHSGLRAAMVLVLALIMIAAAVAGAVRGQPARVGQGGKPMETRGETR